MALATAVARISLFDDPSSLRIGEPFIVAHGWDLDSSTRGPHGLFAFRLEIEGRDVGDGDVSETEDDIGIHLLWEFKFLGLPRGVFTLTGRWFAPCCDAVTYGYPGPCPVAHMPVAVWVEQHTLIVE